MRKWYLKLSTLLKQQKLGASGSTVREFCCGAAAWGAPPISESQFLFTLLMKRRQRSVVVGRFGRGILSPKRWEVLLRTTCCAKVWTWVGSGRIRLPPEDGPHFGLISLKLYLNGRSTGCSHRATYTLWKRETKCYSLPTVEQKEIKATAVKQQVSKGCHCRCLYAAARSCCW